MPIKKSEDTILYPHAKNSHKYNQSSDKMDVFSKNAKFDKNKITIRIGSLNEPKKIVFLYFIFFQLIIF